MGEKLCEYCTYYEEVPTKFRMRENIGGDGEKAVWVHKRKCPFSKDFIQANNPACSYYTPGKFFWCTENHIRINQILCLHRQKTKHTDCPKTCYQGDCVVSGRRGYRPPVENGIIIPMRRKVS
jgi:hypothetical protein